MKKLARVLASVAILSALAGCTDPYNPGQRAVGGGMLGAGAGAIIGALAGGGNGALIGSLAGGAAGAGAGYITTPQVYRPYAPPPASPYYVYGPPF